MQMLHSPWLKIKSVVGVDGVSAVSAVPGRSGDCGKQTTNSVAKSSIAAFAEARSDAADGRTGALARRRQPRVVSLTA